MKKLQQIVFVFTELFSMAVDDFGAKLGLIWDLLKSIVAMGTLLATIRKQVWML